MVEAQRRPPATIGQPSRLIKGIPLAKLIFPVPKGISGGRNAISNGRDGISGDRDRISNDKGGISGSKDGISGGKDGISDDEDGISGCEGHVSGGEVGISSARSDFGALKPAPVLPFSQPGDTSNVPSQTERSSS